MPRSNPRRSHSIRKDKRPWLRRLLDKFSIGQHTLNNGKRVLVGGKFALSDGTDVCDECELYIQGRRCTTNATVDRWICANGDINQYVPYYVPALMGCIYFDINEGPTSATPGTLLTDGVLVSDCTIDDCCPDPSTMCDGYPAATLTATFAAIVTCTESPCAGGSTGKSFSWEGDPNVVVDCDYQGVEAGSGTHWWCGHTDEGVTVSWWDSSGTCSGEPDRTYTKNFVFGFWLAPVFSVGYLAVRDPSVKDYDCADGYPAAGTGADSSSLQIFGGYTVCPEVGGRIDSLYTDVTCGAGFPLYIYKQGFCTIDWTC